MNPVNLDAPLCLEGSWDGSRVGAVRIRNPRSNAAGLLVGRPVGEALQLVPALFSLCSRAQAAAAVAACRSAGADGLPEADACATERAVAIETAQEHLWRLLLDWPPLFGREPRRDRFARLYRRLANCVAEGEAFQLGGDLLDLVAVELLAGFFQSLREPGTLAEFVERARRGGSIGDVLADLIDIGASGPADGSTPLLPAMSAAQWAGELDGLPDEAFQRAPVLRGVAHETGVLARHGESTLVKMLLRHRHRIAARLFARVVDLGDCASRLRHPLAADLPPLCDAAPLGTGAGLACVETARGVLLHAVRIEDGRVADYAVVAPTEWNFHPQGAFAREGCGWSAPTPEAARLRLHALALALDPCVKFDVILRETEHA